ncbi:MAG: hypothetical protein WBC37_14770 [Burkholderiaceae bacterium]
MPEGRAQGGLVPACRAPSGRIHWLAEVADDGALRPFGQAERALLVQLMLEAANSFRDKDRPGEDESGVSLRGQTEAYDPAAGGADCALLQAPTFREAWPGVIQYAPRGLPLGIEMYRQYQQGYQATTTALRFATGLDRRFLRADIVRTGEEYRPRFWGHLRRLLIFPRSPRTGKASLDQESGAEG